METIALKYRDGLFIEADTILEHQRIIDELGYVWYGKLGRAISHKNKEKILSMQKPKILLMNSGTSIVYWAYVSDIVFEKPKISEIPQYYSDRASDFGVWFKVRKFEMASKNILTKLFVVTSGRQLCETAHFSMSPVFVITDKKDKGSDSDGCSNN